MSSKHETEKQNQWRVVASPNGRDGSLTVNQDAALYLAALNADESLTYNFAPTRRAWLQVTRGQIRAGAHTLNAGDGAAIEGESAITVTANSDAEVLLFDLR